MLKGGLYVNYILLKKVTKSCHFYNFKAFNLYLLVISTDMALV